MLSARLGPSRGGASGMSAARLGPSRGGVVCMSAARLGPSAHADHYTCNLPACDPLMPTLLLGPSHGDWFSQMALSVIQGVYQWRNQ